MRVSIHKLSNTFIYCRYVLHLAIADSIFLLTIPFNVVQNVNGQWKFPNAMCKMKESMLFLNYFASVFLLVVSAPFRETIVYRHPSPSQQDTGIHVGEWQCYCDKNWSFGYLYCQTACLEITQCAFGNKLILNKLIIQSMSMTPALTTHLTECLLCANTDVALSKGGIQSSAIVLRLAQNAPMTHCGHISHFQN